MKKCKYTPLLVSLLIAFESAAQISVSDFTVVHKLVTDSISPQTNPNYGIFYDFDGDGQKDYVVTLSSLNKLVLYPGINAGWGNVGEGSFGLMQSLPAISDPVSLAKADVNKDGKMDLVASYWGLDSISIYLNNSSPGVFDFNTRIDLKSPYAASSEIEMADFDGDGFSDIWLHCYYQNNAYFFRNTTIEGGATSFDLPVAVSLIGTQAAEAVVQDLNDDGKIDIALTFYINSINKVQVFRNISTLGNINFVSDTAIATQSQPNRMTFGDFNNDGKLDLVAANYNNTSLSVFQNTTAIAGGKITLRGGIHLPTCSFPTGTISSDLNDDGFADLVSISLANGKIAIHINKGLDTTLSAASFYTKVELAGTETKLTNLTIDDIDGDKRPDFIINTNLNNKVILVKNNITAAVPTVPSSNLLISDITTSSIQLSWTSGNGTKRMMVAKPLSTPLNLPVNNFVYQGNPVFMNGDSIAPDEYVVYVGDGDSVTVSNLQSNTVYHFTLVESNGNDGFTSYFNAGSVSSFDTTDLSIGLGKIGEQRINIDVYPNPVSQILTVEIPKELDGALVKVVDMKGKELINLSATRQTKVNVLALPRGVYLLTISKDNELYMSRFVKE